MRVLVYVILICTTFSVAWAEQTYVFFKDANLEKAVAEELGKEPPLTASEMQQLFTLNCGDINSLEGLENATNLEELIIPDSKIENLAPIRSLNGLRILSLWNNRIKNISPLSDLEHLQVVHLNDNNISDLEPLTSLHSLQKLTLQNNPLNKRAYSVVIPKIRKNNPGITIYHDKTLTPAKALSYAKYSAVVVVILALVIFLAIVLYSNLPRKRQL